MHYKSTAFPPALECAYERDLAEEKYRAFIQTAGLCVFLYIAFGVLDIWALPSSLHQAWAIRAAVVGTTLFCMAMAWRRRVAFLAMYQPLVCLMFVLWGLGIEAIIAHARPGEAAYTAYYAGLMLVTMALFTWTYLRPQYACVVGAALVTSYLALALFWQNFQSQSQAISLFANLFFLLSANTIGLFSLLTRERFSRRAFLLKNALKVDLEMQGEAKRQSDYLSQHDHLTGLPNRLHFERSVSELIEAARAQESAVGILFVDPDNFKPINDTHGHDAGDFVLSSTAQRILSSIGEGDFAARLGGDEFVIAMPLSSAGSDLLERASHALSERLCEPIDYHGRPIRIGASIGMASFPLHGSCLGDVMASADQRMYTLKRSAKTSPADLSAA